MEKLPVEDDIGWAAWVGSDNAIAASSKAFFSKSIMHDGNKVKTVAVYINTGIEFTLKLSW